MLADEILDHLARLEMEVVTQQREYRRWAGSLAPLDMASASGSWSVLTDAVNERDAFVTAIRHHRLEQAHNSELCPLCEPAWKPAPIDRRCPACNAAPGKPCTAPTDASRRPVGWHHLSREAD